MLALLEKHPDGIVVKPNEGTSGKSVFLVSTRPELELAAHRDFSRPISRSRFRPIVEIEDEVRVVVIDERARSVVYSKQRGLNWRHNLDAGARPVCWSRDEAREACVAIAVKAAQGRSGSALRPSTSFSVGGVLVKILEINSGVMMEALGKLHPELVDAAYSAALDKVFGCVRRPGVSRDP